MIEDEEQDRPLDVDAIMAELQARVDADRGGVAEAPMFVAGGADDDAEGVRFNMTLLHSTKPVVGRAVTGVKRAVARSLHTVLEDFANQINAALGDLRETADTAAAQLERVYLALEEMREHMRHLSLLEARMTELDDMAARIDTFDALAIGNRLARLEQRAGADAPVGAYTPTAPVPASVGSLAISRARIDDVPHDRLNAYWTVLDPAAPVLDLSAGSDVIIASLHNAGFSVESADADPLDVLKAQPEASLGGVVAIGLGDHLTPEAWMHFASLAARALRPGGGLVVEVINSTTPAGMSLRSRDPSLAPAVHPETIAFLLRAAGFDDAEVRTVGAFPEHMRAPLDADPDWFGRRLNAMAGVVNSLVVGEPLAAVLARR